MLSAKLVVVGGEVKTTEIKLRLPAVIGRGKGSTITLLQPLVSRQHCELFEANGRLWVRDLGSLNGTYVNNEKVSEAELPPNELLTVGTVTFRAVYEPLGEAASGSDVPQFLPSKAHKQEDEQPTVRVDGPGDAESVATFEEIPVEAIDEEFAVEIESEQIVEVDDASGMPSTPLFSDSTIPLPNRAAPTSAGTPRPAPAGPAAAAPQPPAPAPQRPATPGARPTAPVAIPTAVTPGPAAPTPAAAPTPEVQAEQADEDDDLNDFLRSLGNKK